MGIWTCTAVPHNTSSIGNGAWMVYEIADDNIYLNVLPESNMTRIVRLTTSSLSNLVGLNLDQADDLNTAVEEIFNAVIAEDEDVLDLFRIHYYLLEDGIEVTMEGVPLDLSDQTSGINRYSRFVLESIIDELDDIPNPERGFDIRLVKRLST